MKVKLAYKHNDIGRTVCGTCCRELKPGEQYYCGEHANRAIDEAVGRPVSRYFVRRTDQEQWLVIDSTTNYPHGSYNTEKKAEHLASVLEKRGW
jgi:hypothetical protein